MVACSYTSTTKQVLCRDRQLLAKRCLLTFGITEESITLYRMLKCTPNSTSNLSSLLSQPHLILDALFFRTFCTWFLYGHKSQTPANILFAGSVVRLGLVFKYNYKSTFLEQVGWERCLVVFKGTLKSVICHD